MNKWLVNGVPGESVSVVDRGLTYGDGLFETIAVRDGRGRFLDYHLERLTEGCARLAIPFPGRDVIETEACDLAADCRSGTLKILLTRGTGERGYAPPANPAPTRIVGLIPGPGHTPNAVRQGIVVKLCETRIGVNRRLAGMKTLGRLEQVLARAEWNDPEIGEGLMTTVDGEIICGTMTNVFRVRDGELFTPDLSRCGVRGIMRRVVMEQAQRIGVVCRESDMSPADFFDANEVFVTNSQIGIWPVIRFEGRGFDIGPVTRRLMTALADAGVSECAE
jgi:4-amino-4-deoxychorismate lyase